MLLIVWKSLSRNSSRSNVHLNHPVDVNFVTIKRLLKILITLDQFPRAQCCTNFNTSTNSDKNLVHVIPWARRSKTSHNTDLIFYYYTPFKIIMSKIVFVICNKALRTIFLLHYTVHHNFEKHYVDHMSEFYYFPLFTSTFIVNF